MSNSNCPIGTIVMWGGVNNVPEGWLLCDGTVYPQATYPDLFEVINHNFGNMPQSSSYDPSTEFYVPDLRGRFIRGVDNISTGSARDPDRNNRQDMQSGKVVGNLVGSIQSDEFKKHHHQYTEFPSGSYPISGSGSSHHANSNGVTGSTGGNETRPINAYLYFIIKAL